MSEVLILSIYDRTSKERIIKDTVDLNNTFNWCDLINIYRTIHQRIADYLFFSSLHMTCTTIIYIMGHKTTLSKFIDI